MSSDSALAEGEETSPAVFETLVRVEGATKYFRRGSEEIHVLEKLDLEVPQGEFLALMGPSGSGKEHPSQLDRGPRPSLRGRGHGGRRPYRSAVAA